MLSKLLLWRLLPCFVLIGCGTTVYELNRSETRTNSAPSTGDSTQSSGGTDLGQPVVPPQPVIGSYLAAAFEVPTETSKESCEIHVQEDSSSFYTELNDELFQLLPLADIKQLASIGLICESDDTTVSFSASKLLNEDDRALLASITVNQDESSVKFIARFSLNSSSSTSTGEDGTFDLEVVPNVAAPAAGQSPSPVPTVQSPTPSETTPPAPAGQAPAPAAAPAATPEPTPIPDTTRPTISGIRTATNSDRPTEKYLYITGARDNRRLATRPYSFDGGVSWKSENRKSFPKGTRLEKNTLRVRDAAGNQTLHRIVILVE